MLRGWSQEKSEQVPAWIRALRTRGCRAGSRMVMRVLEDYVPRHIILLLCPLQLCGGAGASGFRAIVNARIGPS
jgi:hypothetical protein